MTSLVSRTFTSTPGRDASLSISSGPNVRSLHRMLKSLKRDVSTIRSNGVLLRVVNVEQQAANLFDHRGAAHHPPFTDSVQRLQVELVIAFDWHKAHRGTGYSFGNSFGIDVAILVRLHLRLHVLGRHQPHIVSLFPQSTAEKM